MRVVMALSILLLISGAAIGQSVYKCKDKNGHVSYLSSPCPTSHQTQKVVAAPPEPVRAYDPTPHPMRSNNTVSNVFYNAPASASARDLAKQRCNEAKQWREGELRRLGLRRTFNDLRRLDDYVNHHCLGT